MRCHSEFQALAEIKPCNCGSLRMPFPADASVVVRSLTPKNQNIPSAGGR